MKWSWTTIQRIPKKYRVKISHIPVQITRHWNFYATHQNSHEISENSLHWIVLKLIYMESDKKVGCNAVFQRRSSGRITHLLINTCMSVTLLHPKFRLHSSTWSGLEIILSLLLTDLTRIWRVCDIRTNLPHKHMCNKNMIVVEKLGSNEMGLNLF